MTQVVLGFDSSCYTTSVSLVSMRGEIKADLRRVLAVKRGALGLRQQEAVFKHIQNFPPLMRDLGALSDLNIIAMAYSNRPTDEIDSYIPVFRVGTSIAQSLATVLDIPSFAFSHQQGHIEAGRMGAGGPCSPPFLAVHISGGTSDLLLVSKNTGWKICRLGQTLDLNAGQFVDRVGVAMGLPFPSGKYLEELSRHCFDDKELSIPSYANECNMSFSGPTTMAIDLLTKGASKPAVAKAVFRCIANTIEKVLISATKQSKIQDVLLVGGVASNSFIRQRLRSRLEHPAVGMRLYFTTPQLSTDNAVGIAHLGCLAARGINTW